MRLRLISESDNGLVDILHAPGGGYVNWDNVGDIGQEVDDSLKRTPGVAPVDYALLDCKVIRGVENIKGLGYPVFDEPAMILARIRVDLRDYVRFLVAFDIGLDGVMRFLRLGGLGEDDLRLARQFVIDDRGDFDVALSDGGSSRKSFSVDDLIDLGPSRM